MGDVMHFDVMFKAQNDWRVVENGRIDGIRFDAREIALAAACVRARQHYQDYGVSTVVRAPNGRGELVCQTRFMTLAA